MCVRLWCFEDADLNVDEAVDVRNAWWGYQGKVRQKRGCQGGKQLWLEAVHAVLWLILTEDPSHIRRRPGRVQRGYVYSASKTTKCR